MIKAEIIQKWIERAKSNLVLSKPELIAPDIYFEDLCFNAQQCVEKALKAYCIFNEVIFPRTHSIF
jgi:HEPN domain-containing protein